MNLEISPESIVLGRQAEPSTIPTDCLFNLIMLPSGNMVGVPITGDEERDEFAFRCAQRRLDYRAQKERLQPHVELYFIKRHLDFIQNKIRLAAALEEYPSPRIIKYFLLLSVLRFRGFASERLQKITISPPEYARVSRFIAFP